MNLFASGEAASTLSLFLTITLLLWSTTTASSRQFKTETHSFGSPSYNASYYDIFAVLGSATISNSALQITPDSAGNFSLANRTGRIFFNHPFTLWENTTSGHNTTKVASFNTSFVLNIYRLNQSSTHGEGVAFLISPIPSNPPPSSTGGFLGLTNSTTDGDPSNRLFAVEFDTHRQLSLSDPDDNHVGVNINSVRSVKKASLSNFGIELAPKETVSYKIWIQYDGASKILTVYVADPSFHWYDDLHLPSPVLRIGSLDLSSIVDRRSYFGFSGSTGADAVELQTVGRWDISVEVIEEEEGRKTGVAMVVAIAAAAAAAVGVAVGWCYWRRMRGARAAADPNILGALKRLPETPREYEFKDLRKATGNFDERNKLGEGGYGVVFKGVLAGNAEVAVKRFSRDDTKSKDDFLAELTIINRLRHKHLVKLLGWCHKNGMLLLVYEYLPNGSLDKHIFARDQQPINWTLRYKILKGVASALHYLHNEYGSTVIHRDLKASNVMLDHDFDARLGDFGLARALDHEKTSYAELEGVHGTMGYIAPECFHNAKATRESDIYALGAVFLEVATGHRPWAKLGGYDCLVDWVWSLHRERRVLDAVDARVGIDNFVPEEAERVLLLGLACSHPMACERPMTQVIVQVLLGLVEKPVVPPFKPAFTWPAMGFSMITSLNSSYSTSIDLSLHQINTT